MICNTIRELPATIEEIRNKAKNDKYITKKKKQIIKQQSEKVNGENMSLMEFRCTANEDDTWSVEKKLNVSSQYGEDKYFN